MAFPKRAVEDRSSQRKRTDAEGEEGTSNGPSGGRGTEFEGRKRRDPKTRPVEDVRLDPRPAAFPSPQLSPMTSPTLPPRFVPSRRGLHRSPSLSDVPSLPVRDLFAPVHRGPSRRGGWDVRSSGLSPSISQIGKHFDDESTAMPRATRSRAPLAPVETNVEGSTRAETGLEEALKALEEEVEAKCVALRAMADDAVAELRQELKLQLRKMPKKVRKMPLQEFREKFSEDIDALLLQNINCKLGDGVLAVAATPKQAVPRTVARSGGRKKEGPSHSEAKTAFRRSKRSTAADVKTPNRQLPFTTPGPGAAKTPGRVLMPATAKRAPKPSEMFFSENGSPLGLYVDGGGEALDLENSLRLKAEDGTEINLAQVAELPDKLREVALAKLMGLQSQVQSIMEKFNQVQ